jgi:hypothetical protein
LTQTLAVAAVAVALALLLGPTTAALAHGTGAHAGFVSVVSTIDPPLPGLLVRVIGGHEQLSVTNLTGKSIVIFDAQNQPLVRVAPGETEVWREPRVGATQEPPQREGLVRNWRIRGTADDEPFVIVGFLGYRPPPGAADEDEGVPGWAVALLVAGGLVVLTASAAAPLLLRRDKT